MTITPRQWERYNLLRQRGWSRAAAARDIKIAYKSAQRYEQEHLAEDEKSAQFRKKSKDRYPNLRPARAHPGPIPLDRLGPEATRALTDFGYFQRRYFGRIATPWQEEGANRVVKLLETPDKEYAVVNAPPGAGKSTLFTLDIPAWLTCRNRAIRGQLGTKVESKAKWYLRRLRRELERTLPLTAEDGDKQKGLALDAEATLGDDFGTFKPETRDVWSSDAFVVAQWGNVLVDEKEPTWSAYGFESGFLGMRFEFVMWDDVVDKLMLRTVESRESAKEWWDDQAEKRLEPGGLLILQGQRMGSDDLYRHCLDKEVLPDDDDGEDDPDSSAERLDRTRKYHHIVFKAHYDDRCTNQHRKTAPYYPEGCLLDPRRVSWQDLRTEIKNPNFPIIYQQEDVDPASVLVDPMWVTGGTDPKTREVYPGCRDLDRSLCELPNGLHGQLVSVATADPSPTKYWSIQWWIVRCADGQPQERYLMDNIRQPMDAPTFLDWSNATQSFTGVMEEWQQRSRTLGNPITCWIVEANAAQRFMLQYEHCRRWMAHHRVRLIPHQTHLNKNADAKDLGVQTLANLYRFGQIRLPWTRGASYQASNYLVSEATHWPGWRTDDCVMAQWFLEWNLPHLIPRQGPMPRLHRPSWLKNADTWKHRRGAA